MKKAAFERFSPANRFRKVNRWLAAATFMLLAAALCAPQRAATATSSIDDFFRDFTAEWVRFNPNLATIIRYLPGDQQARLERQLTPETMAWKKDRIRLARKGLSELSAFDRARMTQEQRISADVMRWQLQILVDEEPYLEYTFPLEQFNGANARIPSLLTVVHPLLNEQDARNYLAALGQVSMRMEEAIGEARERAAKGIIPPRFILQATTKQMREFIGVPASQNPLVTSLSQKMTAVKSIPEGRREELRAEAEKTVAGQVYPAWSKAIALLESQMSQATDDAGVWRFKAGPQIYAYALRRYTTTNLTADQIHEIGLQQVNMMETQMEGLLRRLGRTDGSVKERIEKLRVDLRYPNPTSDESREQIMEDIKGILSDAQKRSALLFDKRPKSPVVAQPYPRFSEANQAASYYPPALDGSRPGTFQYPRRLEEMTKFGLRTLVYHETVPGHHFQIGLEFEDSALPGFRRVGALGIISAFDEGWGLYAERLAAESGWYADDLEGLLGELDSQLFRARRLVVDTGIHAKHWTRQQAIDYGIEPSEVERYTVWPGQACSYMIGELKIVELRDKAKKALGDKFSFQEFHNTVLGTGTVPLDVLERQVDAYIVAAGGKP
jgi:uncharacterized protein (DUF885 family)